MCERALLIGMRESGETLKTAEAHLDELDGLVQSLGIPTAGSLMVTLREVHSRWLLGKGKVEEVAQNIANLDADLVVFDSDLSPGQQRNLEKEWNIAVIDRREVILDIFADICDPVADPCNTTLQRLGWRTDLVLVQIE
jgi:GTP-binding protein HflX